MGDLDQVESLLRRFVMITASGCLTHQAVHQAFTSRTSRRFFDAADGHSLHVLSGCANQQSARQGPETRRCGEVTRWRQPVRPCPGHADGPFSYERLWKWSIPQIN
jgi:hypothetical protein